MAIHNLDELRARIAEVEASFVDYLLHTCLFAKKKGFQDTLSDDECKLMDSIIDLKEDIDEARVIWK